MCRELKIGVVGLDSSHAGAFARLWHDPTHPHHVPGARMVAAYPGGSADWALSATRVDAFTAELAESFGVAILDSIEAVVAAADAVMILTIDGRGHREQFERVAGSGKPVFIDKPLALTSSDVDVMEAVAARSGARVFSASSWRWATGLAAAKAALGDGCERVEFDGPWPLFPGVHGWAFYAMHYIELLYATLGEGCERVGCVRTGNQEKVTGFWAEGREGSFTRDETAGAEFTGLLRVGHREVRMEVRDSLEQRYAALLREVVAFFRQGPVPVAWSETRETVAFLAAAWASREQGGRPVEVERGGS